MIKKIKLTYFFLLLTSPLYITHQGIHATEGESYGKIQKVFRAVGIAGTTYLSSKINSPTSKKIHCLKNITNSTQDCQTPKQRTIKKLKTDHKKLHTTVALQENSMNATCEKNEYLNHEPTKVQTKYQEELDEQEKLHRKYEIKQAEIDTLRKDRKHINMIIELRQEYDNQLAALKKQYQEDQRKMQLTIKSFKEKIDVLQTYSEQLKQTIIEKDNTIKDILTEQKSQMKIIHEENQHTKKLLQELETKHESQVNSVVEKIKVSTILAENQRKKKLIQELEAKQEQLVKEASVLKNKYQKTLKKQSKLRKVSKQKQAPISSLHSCCKDKEIYNWTVDELRKLDEQKARVILAIDSAFITDETRKNSKKIVDRYYTNIKDGYLAVDGIDSMVIANICNLIGHIRKLS